MVQQMTKEELQMNYPYRVEFVGSEGSYVVDSRYNERDQAVAKAKKIHGDYSRPARVMMANTQIAGYGQ